MTITRRDALALGAGALASPFVARAATAQDASWRTLEEVQQFLSGGVPVNAGLALDLPAVWEDGSSVALSALVDSPMTAADHVADLTIFAPRNPAKEVARYHFTPHSGRAEIATRIRLNETQTVVAIARTSAGALYYAEREVRVTVSGCLGVAGTHAIDTLMLARARGPDRFVPGMPGMITTLINHPQHNGGQMDAAGNPLPVNLVTGLTASLDGVTLFSADFHRGVTANPYLRFFVAPRNEGDLVVAWTEDTGLTAIAFVPIRF